MEGDGKTRRRKACARHRSLQFHSAKIGSTPEDYNHQACCKPGEWSSLKFCSFFFFSRALNSCCQSPASWCLSFDKCKYVSLNSIPQLHVDPGLQVEMHPGWRNDKILDFCKRHHIHVTVLMFTPPRNSRGRLWWQRLYNSALVFVTFVSSRIPNQLANQHTGLVDSHLVLSGGKLSWLGVIWLRVLKMLCKLVQLQAYSPLGSQATDELHDPTVTQVWKYIFITLSVGALVQ